MQHIEILVVGQHKKIMDILLRHINANENWKATAAWSVEEAQLLFEQNTFAIVLISSGFDETIENELTAFFKAHSLAVEVVLHYGGGTGLLFNELFAAISKIKSNKQHAD